MKKISDDLNILLTHFTLLMIAPSTTYFTRHNKLDIKCFTSEGYSRGHPCCYMQQFQLEGDQTSYREESHLENGFFFTEAHLGMKRERARSVTIDS